MTASTVPGATGLNQGASGLCNESVVDEHAAFAVTGRLKILDRLNQIRHVYGLDEEAREPRRLNASDIFNLPKTADSYSRAGTAFFEVPHEIAAIAVGQADVAD